MGGELRLKFCRNVEVKPKINILTFLDDIVVLFVQNCWFPILPDLSLGSGSVSSLSLSQHVRFNVVCFTLSLEHEQDELC